MSRSASTDTTGLQKKSSIYRFIPLSGDTLVVPSSTGDVVIIIAPATDLAVLTISWPTVPVNGQHVRILSTKNITSVLHSGGTLNRSVSSLQTASDMNFIYDGVSGVYMSDGLTLSTVVTLPFNGSIAGGSGDVVFYATDNGLVGGNAIFSSIQYVQPVFDSGDPNLAFSKPVVSNSNKTITVNCKKQTFNIIVLLSTNVLGSATLGSAPNGTSLTFLIHGQLA